MCKESLVSRIIDTIDEDEGYRVLRRLDVLQGKTGVGDEEAPFVGVVVDVETTGIDPDKDAIIELALRRFRFDRDGVITAIDCHHRWLEDPGRPLDPEIILLTGYTDDDLAGRRIDDEAAVRLLGSATWVIAHNARFDRRFVERRLPDAGGLAWACSCNDIAWRDHGFDGRGLGWLLSQCGFFHAGHRASEDVDGVIALLQRRLTDGRTALQAMIERAERPSWIVRAQGAAFEVKDRLRMRGYRWDADQKVWWREIAEADRMKEEFWLAGQIYTADSRPRALGPSWQEISRHERYA